MVISAGRNSQYWIYRSPIPRLPLLVRIGLAGLALAGFADLVAHLEASGHAGHPHVHASAETSAHLATFVSMVLVQLGVVADGVRRSRTGRDSAGRSSKGAS